jgi:hypothetical protein
MNKLYMGLSLFLLIAVLVVGLWAISYGGIPEIGLRSFEKGEYGIQYLDYKVLVQILCETETDLVRKA